MVLKWLLVEQAENTVPRWRVREISVLAVACPWREMPIEVDLRRRQRHTGR